jgi:hypothetical protein
LGSYGRRPLARHRCPRDGITSRRARVGMDGDVEPNRRRLFPLWRSLVLGPGLVRRCFVALRLARRRVVGKPKLSISKITSPRAGKNEDIRFTVVNRGEAPVTVTSIGWRVGFPRRRKYFSDTPSAPIGIGSSNSLPIEIKTNQRAVFLIPLALERYPGVGEVRLNWSDYLASNFDGGPARLWAWSVRGWVETSDGRRIFARLEKSLREDLALSARLSRKQI